MRIVIISIVLALASASVVKNDPVDFVIGKDNLGTLDVNMKEKCILKLLNHMLQPTIYNDIQEIAKEYSLEDNLDKYSKNEEVYKFLKTYKTGMLPKGEVFVHTNEKHIEQAVKVFRVLYFAKDFDCFIKTACWLREHINGGMFVYALTAAVFHRNDCKGITLPAPYEIYPYYFVDSHVINNAFVMKMCKGACDSSVLNYLGVQKQNENNLVVIDARKSLRHVLSENDKYAYFTEDIDLNTYFYYLHLNYPYWMSDDVYGLNKERRGEIQMYAYQQLLARLRLERLSHKMCDIKPISVTQPLEDGYWPKIRLHNGEEMPARQNNVDINDENNLQEKLLYNDLEGIIRDGVLTGYIEKRDGTTINLKKPEEIENLAKLILGGIQLTNDNAKQLHLTVLLKKIFSYSQYNINKNTYIPTALDIYTTCLRDPACWKIMKRITDIAVLYKNVLPKYTREEIDFPGVKVESINTDKLVTFLDEQDIDITNAVYLDDSEVQKKNSDTIYVARQRRLNNHPFKVSIDVVSDKAVDAVVRVFLGPKYDCMGRLMNVNDKRLDMVEIDTFVYKLQTGKNNIVRNSVEMQSVIGDRPWTRRIFANVQNGASGSIGPNYWYKSRYGLPQRLILPLGTKGGLDLQLFVIVTPVRTGLVLPNIDVTAMKDRQACPWSTCIDTMPLGFPFDREIDTTCFSTNNMKFQDVSVYQKDLELSNTSKNIDISNLTLKRDDMTYLDKDCLVQSSYMDVMTTYGQTTGN